MSKKCPTQRQHFLRRSTIDLFFYILCVSFLCLTFSGVGSAAEPAKKPAADLEADSKTLTLLRVEAKKKTLVDSTGRFTPTVTGGTVIDDEVWGPCLKLGDGDGNGIVLKDDGKIDFTGGVRIDAWLNFEQEPPAKAASLALKVGSFAWDVGKGKLNTSWLVFPSEPIVTTTPAQFKYFPVGGDLINGLMQVPLKKWTRLTIAYDEPLGAVTTQIDGMTDRFRYRYRGGERMSCDGHSPVNLLAGFKNCRVGAIRINTGRPQLAPPSLEVYVNQLPYQDQVLLTFDHIDPDLPLPIEATIVWEKASGESATVRTISLDSHAKHDLLLDMPTWKNTLHTIIVNASAGGRGVYSKNFRIACVHPDGPIKIGKDRTVWKDGKAFFPVMIYHSMPEDFPLLAEIGFNVLLNDFNIRQHAAKGNDEYNRLLKESLEAAGKNKLLLLAVANADYNKLHTIPVAKDQPSLFGWYGADEPWGDLSRLVESYNTVKMLEPNLPVLIIQNNYSRLQDTAQGADIVGTDPYPIPNVSLRAVVDATHAAQRAVSNHKPVWTVIPQYDLKIPTRDEMRCMAWLAVISGADGLGFFDWDERRIDPVAKTKQGWYTKEHPEQVENLRIVVKELRSLEHILLAPATASQPSMQPVNAAIHAFVKSANGKRYLLLANDSRQAEETTLIIDDLPDGDAHSLAADTAQARLHFHNGEAAIKLPPLGVEMFELSELEKKK